MQKFSHPDWWEEKAGFFGRDYMEGDDSCHGYLSTPLTLQERTRHEVDGVIRLLHLRPGQSVLDCPCGYGRHSLALARYGIEVTGIDINQEELHVARQGAKGLTTIQFRKEDMRFLEMSHTFDAIVNLFYSFGFFATDEENFAVLRNFRQALKPGGKFLMHTDVNLSRVLQGGYKFTEQRHLRSGKTLQIVERYDPESKRMQGSWTLVEEDGHQRQLTPYSVRVYSFDEFAQWCYQAGFTHISGYGDWEGNPLTRDSEDMIVIAW